MNHLRKGERIFLIRQVEKNEQIFVKINWIDFSNNIDQFSLKKESNFSEKIDEIDQFFFEKGTNFSEKS